MNDLNEAKAQILVRVFDGTRKLIDPSANLLITLIDGYGNHFPGFYKKGPEVIVSVPFNNNLQDSYTVVVSAKGYKDGGYRPVKVSRTHQQVADVMLLPRVATFRFRDSDFAALQQSDRALSRRPKSGLGSVISIRWVPITCLKQFQIRASNQSEIVFWNTELDQVADCFVQPEALIEELLNHHG